MNNQETANNGRYFPTAVYKQTADIDLSGVNWTPIGLNSEIPFMGIYDGDGYDIKNLTINCGDNYAGLFGCVGLIGSQYNSPYWAELKNIRIINGDIVGKYCGVIAYSVQQGIVYGCYTNSKITAGSRAGGVVGILHHGRISNCISNNNIISTEGSPNLGGILGCTPHLGNEYSNKREIFNCFNETVTVSKKKSIEE